MRVSRREDTTGGVESSDVGWVEHGYVFFFQAEDGIRDYKVTGVQTCALPISHASLWHQLTTDGLPVQGWINSGLEWVVHHFRPFFQAVRTPIDGTLSGITDADRKSVV